MQSLPTALSEPDYGFLSRLNLPSRGGTTDHVAQLLREAIVASELPPGALINKHTICERLGVSRFPVSEALARLQTEGLVEILPQRGTRVTRIRLDDVRESMFIRRALEAETARMVAPTITDETIAALTRNIRYQTAALEAEDRSGFHALDLEFHQILIGALTYDRVRLAIEAARSNLERARRILVGGRRSHETYAEHVAIFDALVARDAARAGEAMSHHLNHVIDELVAFSRDRPDVFEAGSNPPVNNI
jgi:DNA-binding GntR family transcriptional regulator